MKFFLFCLLFKSWFKLSMYESLFSFNFFLPLFILFSLPFCPSSKSTSHIFFLLNSYVWLFFWLNISYLFFWFKIFNFYLFFFYNFFLFFSEKKLSFFAVFSLLHFSFSRVHTEAQNGRNRICSFLLSFSAFFIHSFSLVYLLW